MEAPLFCDRCATELVPGTGNFYAVSIRAVADPTGPTVEDSRSADEIRASIERLLAQLEDASPQEAMDQVHRRVTLYLCRSCFSEWIENPAGS
jgi:hypothetical protein